MNTIEKTMEFEQTKKYTENGATAFHSANCGALLDLFGMAGALRNRLDEVGLKFNQAYAEDPTLATKLLFYSRDIRGGLGERDIARKELVSLAYLNPIFVKNNLDLVIEFGRWDDLFILLETPVKDSVIKKIYKQLEEDVQNYADGKQISLLAKWMPSINTSSYKTRKLAEKLCDELQITPRKYRKILSTLRAYLNVTEVRMSEKEYSLIRYEAVSSNAMNRYRNAFMKNDRDHFQTYLEEVSIGKEKIHSSTLFPYDIVKKYMYPTFSYFTMQKEINPVLEEQWKALPNYVEDGSNILIMADTSGSMIGKPIATALGLAIYFAERNTGLFAGKFLTFSKTPHLETVTGKSLLEKINHAEQADWEMNTNIEAAFELLLQSAKQANVSKEEMPKMIVVISDMEFDSCGGEDWSFYDEMSSRFEKLGYTIPTIVFWNVDARHDTFHVSGERKEVVLASGQSTSVFKTLMESVNLTPIEYMMKVLNQPRYNCVKVD